MPAPAAARPAAGAAAADERPDWKWQVAKAALAYFAIQSVMGPNGLIARYRGASQAQQNAGGLQTAPDGTGAPPGSAIPASSQPAAPQGVTLQGLRRDSVAAPMFKSGSAIDIYLFLTEASSPTREDLATQFSSSVAHGSGAWGQLPSLGRDPIDWSNAQYAALFEESYMTQHVVAGGGAKDVLPAAVLRNVTLGQKDLNIQLPLSFSIEQRPIQHSNASIWLDILAAPTGSSLLPLERGRTMRMRKLLTRLFPQRRHREARNLFGRSEANATDAPEIEGPAPLVGYWHRNVSLAMIGLEEGQGLPIGQLPPQILQHVHLLEDESEKTVWFGKDAVHYPLVYANDFWLLRDEMYPINKTVSELPLNVEIYTSSFFKFQMLASLTDSFEKQPGMAGSELDMIKTVLLTTNPWYLALTIAVSILHSVFEFLAFSSDVKHWKNKENLAGVSVGSILTNVFVQIVILLYLIDQSEETSWMILAGNGVGVCVEAWKLTKAVTVSLIPSSGLLPYKISIKDKHVLSAEEVKTAEFDKLAFKIVGSVMAPVLIAYTAYSAVYQQHKGWWSFTIGTLSAFVYTFGVVALVPQLIVNYKCKSVAGFSSKTFVFKILSTVVDDLFAFAIPMPTLHRLACFRDDLVFLILLYQRYIYGVDNTRANEYGQVVASKEKDVKAVTVGSEKKELAKAQDGESKKTK